MGVGAVVSPDQVSIGVLVDAVPRDSVDEAVAVCGVRERPSDGKLPAHVTAYLTLGLSLFPEDDYEEVATKVTGSLDRFGCWDARWSVPTASAITQARKRLGPAVFPELFERTCGPVAGDTSPTAGLTALGTARGAFLRRWRLLAIDGFELDVPDTPGNAAEFGYAGSGENRSAFPKARVVALCECGTHAFLAAEIGPIGGKGTGELIAVLTTITEPGQASAEELADVYHQRWEQETGHDQLKTHLRGPGKVLRSRLPELVYQEIWAYLIVHHAISALIAKASAAADLDPDRISFVKAVRLIRRTATGTADIPPSGLDRRTTGPPGPHRCAADPSAP